MKILEKILYVLVAGTVYGLITTIFKFMDIQLGVIGTIVLLVPFFIIYKLIFPTKNSSLKLFSQLLYLIIAGITYGLLTYAMAIADVSNGIGIIFILILILTFIAFVLLYKLLFERKNTKESGNKSEESDNKM